MNSCQAIGPRGKSCGHEILPREFYGALETYRQNKRFKITCHCGVKYLAVTDDQSVKSITYIGNLDVPHDVEIVPSGGDPANHLDYGGGRVNVYKYFGNYAVFTRTGDIEYIGGTGAEIAGPTPILNCGPIISGFQ